MDLRLVIDRIDKYEALPDGRIYLELGNVDKKEFQCMLNELITENEIKSMHQTLKEGQGG